MTMVILDIIVGIWVICKLIEIIGQISDLINNKDKIKK